MHDDEQDWKLLMIQVGLCALFMITAIVMVALLEMEGRVVTGAYLAAMIFGGWDTFIGAWKALKNKQIDIHTLMLTVAIGAAVIGSWQEGALLLFLFALGSALEHYALSRMNREISALHQQSPKIARVLLPDGRSEERSVEDIQMGDQLLVRPDEIFPVDGTVLSGSTEVDESTLTGEAMPVTKKTGEVVSSGSLNLWGKVIVKTLRPVQESALAKIIYMIREAQESKAPSQRFTDRFGSKYAIGVIAFAIIMFCVWWFIFDLEPSVAGYRAMTLLVVVSPCALVLSIPSAILAGIAWGAKHGVFFRGGSAIEELATIDTVALDKTGTLTAGKMKVLEVETFPAGRETELLEIAFALERDSNHPIARAITHYCQELGISEHSISNLHSLTGLGIRADVDGQAYSLGRRQLIENDFRVKDLNEGEFENTEVWLTGKDLIGRILLHDEIRLESKALLEGLRSKGLRTVMLTGDNRRAAEPVARELGLSEVHAGLHPDDKVELIYKMIEEGRRVAMVGDGVNDAPSLAAAHVSISMGGRGSDAALEQADVVLVNDRIELLESAINLSKKARGIIYQNLALSLGTVVIMVCTTLLTSIPLSVAVIVHESTTVLVCFNSLRLLFSGNKNSAQSSTSSAEKA